jgi:hypothetical protein
VAGQHSGDTQVVSTAQSGAKVLLQAQTQRHAGAGQAAAQLKRDGRAAADAEQGCLALSALNWLLKQVATWLRWDYAEAQAASCPFLLQPVPLASYPAAAPGCLPATSPGP